MGPWVSDLREEGGEPQWMRLLLATHVLKQGCHSLHSPQVNPLAPKQRFAGSAIFNSILQMRKPSTVEGTAEPPIAYSPTRM